MAGEVLQAIQVPRLFECFRIEFDTGVGRVDPRTTTVTFFPPARMRGTVGTEEEFGLSAHGCC